jgi:hypothetical protein
MLRAIYAYKHLDKFWKEPSKDFYTLAKLSTLLAARHYVTTLYTDEFTHEIFKKEGVEFDEVIYLPSLEIVTENNYGMSKVLAMMEQTEPYIILDLDTLIFEPITSDSTVTYGYKEGETDKVEGIHYIQKYYLNSYERYKHKIDLTIDWSIYPNNCLVAVKNPFIIREIYTKVLEIIDNDYFNSTVQFYEQKLLYDFLVSYDTDIRFLYERTPVPEKESMYEVMDVVTKKFAHLDYYFRQPNCVKLLPKLQEFLRI